MAIKSKGKFVDFLRLLYAFLSAAGKKLGVALRHARERVAYWYDSQEVKPQDRALAFAKKLITFSWYREMDDKARARFRHLLLRALIYSVMLAGVLCIATACFDFKDMLAYVRGWGDEQIAGETPEGADDFTRYFLTRADYDLEWRGAQKQGARQPDFTADFASKLKDAVAYSPNQNLFVKKGDFGNDNDYYRNKFVTCGYRFFLCDSQDPAADVRYSNWAYYKDDYAAMLMPGSNIHPDNKQSPAEKNLAEQNLSDLNKRLEKVTPRYVSDIERLYGRYVCKFGNTLTIGGQQVVLYLAVSDFNIVDTGRGAAAMTLLIIGSLLALFSVVVNTRISAKYKNGEGRLKMFNRKPLTLFLAVYLLVGFAVLAAIFFIWYADADYIRYDTNKLKAWTYGLSVVYALLTFLTTSAIGNGLAVAQQNAVLLKKMKAELVANVSHDIKTPLTSIIGYVGLLEQDPSLSPEAKSYVGILKTKSERLKSIVSDLFELSKSTAGNSELRLEKLDLKKLILQTLADMEDVVEASSRVILQDLPGREVVIRADGAKLYRVFQNLIGNALKYSAPDVPIRLKCRVVGKKAIVEIRNTASYKMDFTAEEVLSRYARGKGTMAEDGIGLGLSIADTFVRECGGEMSIRIEEDQFRVFVIFRTA